MRRRDPADRHAQPHRALAGAKLASAYPRAARPVDDCAGVGGCQCQHGLLRHFLVSGYRVVAGILLAMLVALPLGLMLGQSPSLNRFFSPIVYISLPIPKIVFLPVILLLFGIGDTSKIFIIFIVLFFQILVVVRDQAAALRPELIYSVRSLGAGRRALFRFVYLPATVPCRADCPQSEHRHGRRRALLRRVVCDLVRPGLLYLCRQLAAAGLPRDVCRRDRHEPCSACCCISSWMDWSACLAPWMFVRDA